MMKLEIGCCYFSFILLFMFELLLFANCLFGNISSQMWLRMMTQLLKSYWYSCSSHPVELKVELILPNQDFSDLLHLWISAHAQLPGS
jgi:hypothetical protein